MNAHIKYPMSKITGTNLTAPIVPQDTADTYPTHHALYGKGGWKSVPKITDRNAMPVDRLEEGTVIYVVAEKTPYLYQDGAWLAFGTDFQAALDDLNVKWAGWFIGLEATIVDRWNQEWKQ